MKTLLLIFFDVFAFVFVPSSFCNEKTHQKRNFTTLQLYFLKLVCFRNLNKCFIYSTTTREKNKTLTLCVGFLCTFLCFDVSVFYATYVHESNLNANII